MNNNGTQIIVNQALQKNIRFLSEPDSKKILASYGIPFVKDQIIDSEKELEVAIEEFGLPLVLKAFGPEIPHKSELGLVKIGLRDKTEIAKAYSEIQAQGDKKIGVNIQGLLAQPMFKGRREFVSGMFRDPQFGPVIMFGLGGIFTEALQDVTFRVAPVTRQDCLEMLSELKAKSLLSKFRTERSVNKEQIVNILLGLSQLALDCPEILEVDINPLLANSKGELMGVDALVVVGKNALKTTRPANDPGALGHLFHPKSVAFVGASGTLGKWGHMLFNNCLSGGYTGAVYLVNPKGGTIAGRPVYPSVLDIPGNVDLTVVTVPAARVLSLLDEFAQKKIKSMVLISSGFSETGEQGKILEQQVVDKARKAGILILGPNTMGICNPHINFHCTGSVVHAIPGSIAMVSQSGNMGVQLLSFAEKQGIGIRGFCGSGNEAMLTIEDYMAGLKGDETTKTVMLYVESVKNGERFLKEAKELSRKKPVVLLKGGETQAGQKAASSHTGAMSSDSKIFSAVCSQAGIIKVEGPTDLLDLSAAFSSLPLPKGNKVAIMTLGGGWGVITADLCAKYGLVVPALSKDLIAYFDELLPAYWSRANPVDLVGERDLSLPIKGLEALLAWEECDAVINLGILGRRIYVQRYLKAAEQVDPNCTQQLIKKMDSGLAQFEQNYLKVIAQFMEKYEKPVFGVRLESAPEDKTVISIDQQKYSPVFYQTPERAVKACAEMSKYQRFLSRQNK